MLARCHSDVGRIVLPALLLAVLWVSGTAHALDACSTSICSGDPCTIPGTYQFVNPCDLNFGTKTVTVTGRLASGVAGGSLSIEAGALVVQGEVQALGGNLQIQVSGDLKTQIGGGGAGRIDVHQGGSANLVAGGDVVLNGSEISADGNTNDFTGDVTIQAHNITVGGSTIHANGSSGGDGGTITLLANGDVTIGSLVSAVGNGGGTSGGIVDVEAGPSGTVTVNDTLNVSTSSTGLYDGTIVLGPACSVVVSGTLKARTSNLSSTGLGSNSIYYSGALNVSGGTLLADANGGTRLFCRCVDTTNDGTCDGGCVNAPTGLGSAPQTPAAVVSPLSLPPCGWTKDCSNPPRPNGTGCDDRNRCTQTDTCQGGVCVGAQPVACLPLDQCHTFGTCDPSTGACSNPGKTNGTPCDDGDICTNGDACENGICSGQPVVCQAQDLCHTPGTCDPATGCSNPVKPDGTVCGDQCTQGVCRAGSCIGTCLAGRPCVLGLLPTICQPGLAGSCHCGPP